MNFSLSFNSLDRPECLRKAMASACDGGWKFASKLVCDDASNERNFEKILRYCEEYQFDVIRKIVRRTWTNSCNLSIIYGDSRYVITSNDDMIIVKDSKWLDRIEEGFDKGYEMVNICRMEVFAIDKNIIPIIGWHDERYPFVGVNDGDWLIRMYLHTGEKKDFSYNPEGGKKKSQNNLVLHLPHKETMDEPRIWIVAEELQANIDFFFQKWEVDRKRILAEYPELVLATDSVIAQKAYGIMAVKRKMEEEDFYPKMTERYRNGNFKAYERRLSCVEKIYRFNKEV